MEHLDFWTVVAFVVLAFMLYMLFRPDPYKDQKVYSTRSVEAIIKSRITPDFYKLKEVLLWLM